MLNEAVGRDCGVKVTPVSKRMMRFWDTIYPPSESQLIGMPKKVLGALSSSYDGFAATYESALNQVPVFDAHIEIYSAEKIARVNYDTSYVKGLPTTMTVSEKVGEAGYQERTLHKRVHSIL